MKPYKSLLLGGGAYCEGMPFVLGNGGDLDEHVVSRLKGEVGGPRDHQVSDLVSNKKRYVTMLFTCEPHTHTHTHTRIHTERQTDIR